jgi:hypothetical protein
VANSAAEWPYRAPVSAGPRLAKPVAMPRALLLTASILLSLTASQAFAQEATVEKGEAFPRLRLGFSVGVGGGSMGLGVAASARAGIQIKSSWAVSYQISAAETGEILGSSDDWRSHALLVEFTVPETSITLGAGPSIVSGHIQPFCGFFCAAPPPSDYTDVGLDFRLARTFGARRANVRGGFTLELAAHSSIHDTVVVLGIGADLF